MTIEGVAQTLQAARRALQQADREIAALQAQIDATDAGQVEPVGAAPSAADRLISVAEAAKRSGRSKEAVTKRLRRSGVGQKVGGRWFLAERAIRDLYP